MEEKTQKKSSFGKKVLGFFKVLIIWSVLVYVVGQITNLVILDKKSLEYLGLWAFLAVIIPFVISYKYKFFRIIAFLDIVFVILFTWARSVTR